MNEQERQISLLIHNKSMQIKIIVESMDALSQLCEESEFWNEEINKHLSESIILVHEDDPIEAADFLNYILQRGDMRKLRWRKGWAELSQKWKMSRYAYHYSSIMKEKVQALMYPIRVKNSQMPAINGFYVMDCKASEMGKFKFVKHPYTLIIKRNEYVFFVANTFGELKELHRAPRSPKKHIEISTYENFKRAGIQEFSNHNPLHIFEFWEMVEVSLTCPTLASSALNTQENLVCYLAFNRYLWSEEHIRKQFNPEELHKALLLKFNGDDD